MTDVSVTPAAPGGCATWDALEKKHAADKAFVESKIAAMKKPRLGRPIPSAQVELQSAALRDDVAKKVEAERAQMESYLAFVAAQPKADPAISSSDSTAGVDSANSATTEVEVADEDSDGDSDGPQGAAAEGPRKSKAQRRREKKAAAAATTASAAAAAASAPAPSMKEAELRAIIAKLKPSGFDVFPVAADGHCLFRATADQLMRLRGKSGGAAAAAAPAGGAGAGSSEVEYLALRRRAATYIRLHASDFAPFLPYEKEDRYPEGADASSEAVHAAVDRYCTRLANTAAWGGHPEIRALACTLGIPFLVYQAEGEPWRLAPEEETMDADAASAAARRRAGEEGLLRLSFHRHYYALGEHYNSVVPVRR